MCSVVNLWQLLIFISSSSFLLSLFLYKICIYGQTNSRPGGTKEEDKLARLLLFPLWYLQISQTLEESYLSLRSCANVQFSLRDSINRIWQGQRAAPVGRGKRESGESCLGDTQFLPPAPWDGSMRDLGLRYLGEKRSSTPSPLSQWV